MLQCERCTSDTVNIKDDMGRTVLHWCCLHNRRDMVTMLIKKGVNIGIVDKSGRMAEELAKQKGHRALVEWLTNGAFPKSENPHLLKSAALVKRLGRGRTMEMLMVSLRELGMETQAATLEATREEVLDMTEVQPATQSLPEVFVPKVSLQEQAEALRGIIPQIKEVIVSVEDGSWLAEEPVAAANSEAPADRIEKLHKLSHELEKMAEDLAPASI
eukprot:TRINITY_DN44996_c0_g1_i4.p1 TRINITY_DN44996_c0_g1~~TRINITY_DN44996_c0_g1_i4.p1  ORF type:complete len:216 (-),score=72.27 TRINITY_DN44996_c0_g1_i4:460-1107(-)